MTVATETLQLDKEQFVSDPLFGPMPVVGVDSQLFYEKVELADGRHITGPEVMCEIGQAAIEADAARRDIWHVAAENEFDILHPLVQLTLLANTSKLRIRDLGKFEDTLIDKWADDQTSVDTERELRHDIFMQRVTSGMYQNMLEEAAKPVPPSKWSDAWFKDKFLAAGVKISNFPRWMASKAKAPEDWSKPGKIYWYGVMIGVPATFAYLCSAAILELRYGVNITPLGCSHGAPCDTMHQHIQSAMQGNYPSDPASNLHPHHFVEPPKPTQPSHELPQIPKSSVRETEWDTLQEAGVKPNKIMGLLNSAAEHSGKPFKWIGKGLKRYLQVKGSTDTQTVLDELGFISN